MIAKLLYLSCNIWISLEPTAECRSKGVRPSPACRTLGEVNLVARHNLPRVSNCCILHEPLLVFFSVNTDLYSDGEERSSSGKLYAAKKKETLGWTTPTQEEKGE